MANLKEEKMSIGFLNLIKYYFPWLAPLKSRLEVTFSNFYKAQNKLIFLPSL